MVKLDHFARFLSIQNQIKQCSMSCFFPNSKTARPILFLKQKQKLPHCVTNISSLSSDVINECSPLMLNLREETTDKQVKLYHEKLIQTQDVLNSQSLEVQTLQKNAVVCFE